jgi:cyclic-di-AMP phosphodiesterase PgpH
MTEDVESGPLEGQFQGGSVRGFFERNLWVRLVVGIIFTVCLFFFLHFQQVKVEVLEVNTEAPEYIVAQVDFAFPDDEGTILRRQEAIRDIGKIYLLTSKEIAHRQTQFEQMLSSPNGKWREQVEKATADDMYRAGDLLAMALSRERFTDQRTLKKMRTIELATTHYYVFSPADPSQKVKLPEEFWQQLAKGAFEGSEVSGPVSEFVVKWFSQNAWTLEEDGSAMTAVRDLAQRAVTPVVTQQKAGTRILDKGQTVTSRHVAMLQAMHQALQQQKNLWHPTTLVGSILLALVFVIVAAAYLRAHHRSIFYSNKKLLLLLVITLLTLAIAKGIEYLFLRSSSDLADVIRYPLFVPFAAILLCSLLNGRIAAYASAFLAVVMTFALAVDAPRFLVMNITTALVAVLSTRTLRKRKEVFMVCAKAWIAAVVVLIAFHLYALEFWTVSLVVDMASSFAFMLLTAVLVVGLLPLLESVFRIFTEVTLMEYMDPTHPILRRLSIEAPGTYQHSIVVGNLAETAAIAIGANGLFCRVATLYHDIGKLISPQYFTENQSGGVNIHQLLTPLESAQVIMAHVPEGVAIARKHNLPEPFLDIIREHHGTTLVYFFYHQEVQKHGGDSSKVNEADFRYNGPKPRSKESAIIMMADTLEAASRSLEEANEENVRAMVNKLTQQKIDDGQFDRALLTYEDMQKVKESLVTSIMAASHTRIKYPERQPPAGTADDPAVPEEEA